MEAHQWHALLGYAADFLRVMEVRADRGSFHMPLAPPVRLD